MSAERAWIKSVPDREATGKVREIYERIESAYGSNFNITRVAGLWPELLEVQEKEISLFLKSETNLSSEMKDLIAAHIAGLNRCEYCDNWYRTALKMRGWSDEKITHILQDIESEHLDDRSRAIIMFADKLTRKPQAMSLEDIDRMRQAGLDDRTILETAALAAFNNYMTRLANALGILIED